MIDRLNSFLEDDSTRWRAILWSWMAGTIAGAVASALTDSLNTLAFASIGVSLVAFAGVLFSYVMQASSASHYRIDRRMKSPPRKEVSSKRPILAFAASLALALIMEVITKNEANAEIIDERLRRMARDPNPGIVKAAATLVSIANANRIMLSTDALDAVVTRRLTLDDVGNAVEMSVQKQADALGITSKTFGVKIEKQTDVGQIFLNGISLEGTNMRAFGYDPRAFPLFPPSLVAFIVPIRSPLESPKRPGAPMLEVAGNSYHVSFSLDGMHTRNAIFIECIVIYTGKPVKLENTGFVNCRFEFSANLTCQRLAQDVLANPSVTFSEP